MISDNQEMTIDNWLKIYDTGYFTNGSYDAAFVAGWRKWTKNLTNDLLRRTEAHQKRLKLLQPNCGHFIPVFVSSDAADAIYLYSRKYNLVARHVFYATGAVEVFDNYDHDSKTLDTTECKPFRSQRAWGKYVNSSEVM